MTLASTTDDHPQVTAVGDAVVSTLMMVTGSAPLYVGADETPCTGDQIIGIISFTGLHSCYLMLCLPRETASALAVKFAGFEIAFDSADMGDVVGELANVAAGKVVANLETMGLKAEMSLPAVIRGASMSLPVPDGLEGLRMNYSSSDGPFFMELVFERSLRLEGECRTHR